MSQADGFAVERWCVDFQLHDDLHGTVDSVAFDGRAVGLGWRWSRRFRMGVPKKGAVMAGDWHWWLVTWGTYGSWLPGDERGFRTWRKREYVPPVVQFAGHDEATYDPREYRERQRRSRERCEGEVRLSEEEQRIVVHAIVADIAGLPIEPKILSVTSSHVHLLAVFGETGIRPTVGRLKSRATKALKLSRSAFRAKRVWAKGCHMRSLEVEDARITAYIYVHRHESQGLVHAWYNHPKPTALPSTDGG